MGGWRVVYSEDAKVDIRSIFEYIAFELKAKQTAINQVQRILKGVSKLNLKPNRHPLYKEAYWSSRGLRVLVIDNYNVFYITLQSENTVVIVRIQYGGRDIEKQFNGSLDIGEVTC